MYRQEAERARFHKEAPTIDEFLAGLGLADHDRRARPRAGRPRGAAHPADQPVQLHHDPPQRRRGPPAGRVGPGMPGRGGERPVRRLRPGRRDDLRPPRRGAGGRHVPPELPGAGPGRRAPDARRAGGDRPGLAGSRGSTRRSSSPRRTSRRATSSRQWRRPTGGRSRGACGTRSRRKRPRASPIARRRRPGPRSRPAAGRRGRGGAGPAARRPAASRDGSSGSPPSWRCPSRSSRRSTPDRGAGGPGRPAARRPCRPAPRSNRRWPGSGPTCCGSSRWGPSTTSSSWAGRRSWPSTCSPGSSGDSARRCR